MSGRLIAIDKSPGIRPIGIGETWRRAIAQSVLHVAGVKLKSPKLTSFGAGMEPESKAAFTLQHLWELHKVEEEWISVDARNAFTNNRTNMLGRFKRERRPLQLLKHWGTL
jgi:hypothetical protein